MRSKEHGKLVLASALSELIRVEDEVMQILVSFGYSEHDRFAIKLAMEEALANAIKHGNAHSESKRVFVEFEITERQATFTIEDEGDGFDVHHVPDPTLEENLTKPSGRGVMLMHAYMDSVEYNDKGTRVSFTKKAAPNNN